VFDWNLAKELLEDDLVVEPFNRVLVVSGDSLRLDFAKRG
jgi:hypothetical protein